MMGHGMFSESEYEDLKVTRLTTKGVDSFTYDKDVRSGVVEEKVHDRLSPNGVKFRESRDSDDHPVSNAISVLFDTTGSMRSIPRVLQQKLPKLMGHLLRKGVIEGPQVLFGAIGDATSDRVPLQVGQFESNVAMDEDIDKIYLEGNGGPYGQESYELGMYFMARHTAIDCLEKRGKKGYLFIIGDEQAYPKVKRTEVNKLIDDGLQSDVSLEDIVNELQSKYEVFFIIPTSACGGNNSVVKQFWTNLFGQNVLKLENPDLVCELIVTTIGLTEGTLESVTELGVDARTADVVTRAVSTVVRGRGTVANVSGGSLVPSSNRSVLEEV